MHYFQGLPNFLYSIRLDNAMATAKEKVAKYYGIPKKKLTTSYRIKNLGNIFDRMGLVGKILGAFYPYSDKIDVDPINFERGGLLEVLVHELIHKVQKITGKIYISSRRTLEREAYSVTRDIMEGNLYGYRQVFL